MFNWIKWQKNVDERTRSKADSVFQLRAIYYVVRKFGSASLAALTGYMNQTESQPIIKALKNRAAWVNESSSGKSKLDNKVLSLCLLIRLCTMAEPEVGGLGPMV